MDLSQSEVTTPMSIRKTLSQTGVFDYNKDKVRFHDVSSGLTEISHIVLNLTELILKRKGNAAASSNSTMNFDEVGFVALHSDHSPSSVPSESPTEFIRRLEAETLTGNTRNEDRQTSLETSLRHYRDISKASVVQVHTDKDTLDMRTFWNLPNIYKR